MDVVIEVLHSSKNTETPTQQAAGNRLRTSNLEPQDVDSLVQTPRRNEEAAGNRVCVHLQRFEELANEVQITKACDSAGFMRTVSIGMSYKTGHDVDDGFEGKTGTCRVYTKPREDPDSEIIAWIGGPALHVKTT